MRLLILFFLRGTWRERFLQHNLSPAGQALYTALQSADGWEISAHTLRYGSTTWCISNGAGELKLHAPDRDVLSGFEKRVCWKEIGNMYNRKVAMAMQRHQVGGAP